MKKCIILSRVSTERQNVTQQTDLLIQKAKNDGYKDNNIIIIEDKESAIKKSVEEREGLRKLKSEIEKNNDVDIVYIYEISRLGRRMDVLIEMRDYFVEHQIQLYIYNNNQYLLEKKEDKLVLSFVGGLIFTLFSQFAESEMKDKKDRMKRGKQSARNEGKYLGGIITFGYKLGENKKIEIDEKNADIVRKIFNDYEKGWGYSSIGQELMLKGDIKTLNIKSAIAYIKNVINRREYTGEIVNGRILPQIISKEQFERCQKIAHNRFKPKSNIKNIYWCKNLLKTIDKITGKEYLLSPIIGAVNYRYYDENLKSIGLNINFIDSLTWYVVKKHRLDSVEYDAKTEADEANKYKDEYEKKLKQCDVRIERIQSKKERWLQLYVDGRINEKRLDEEEYKISQELANIEMEKDDYNHKITEMMNRIIYATSWFYEKSINDVKSDEEIFDIIHNDVEKILVFKGGGMYEFNISFYMKNGFVDKFKICTNNINRYVINEKGENVKFEYIERFKRKKYIK